MIAIALLAAAMALAPTILLPIVLGGVFVWMIGASWFGIETGVAVCWLAAATITFSELSPDFGAWLLLKLSEMAIGASWALRLLAMCVSGWSAKRWSASWAAWLIAPSIGAIGLALVETDRDFELRLRLSEPALKAASLEVIAGARHDFDGRPRWIGLLSVKDVREQDGAVYWTMPGGFLDEVGLAYMPAGIPPSGTPRRIRVTHHRGPWWAFTRKW